MKTSPQRYWSTRILMLNHNAYEYKMADCFAGTPRQPGLCIFHGGIYITGELVTSNDFDGTGVQ